jgi:hypothetical protein
LSFVVFKKCLPEEDVRSLKCSEKSLCAQEGLRSPWGPDGLIHRVLSAPRDRPAGTEGPARGRWRRRLVPPPAQKPLNDRGLGSGGAGHLLGPSAAGRERPEARRGNASHSDLGRPKRTLLPFEFLGR